MKTLFLWWLNRKLARRIDYCMDSHDLDDASASQVKEEADSIREACNKVTELLLRWERARCGSLTARLMDKAGDQRDELLCIADSMYRSVDPEFKAITVHVVGELARGKPLSGPWSWPVSGGTK